MDRKYVIVCGGNISGIGKGICAASISTLLKEQGYKIANMKIDGYLNCDAGVLSPLEHGETFVTKDGGEIDLDFGTYERFTGEELTKDASITSGKMFTDMLKLEREGKFLGQTVQLTPHYTNYINDKIITLGEKQDVDIVIVEIGGTVGDKESEVFLEAIRQLKNKVGKENVMYMLLTFIPFLRTSKELKTKLTQQAIKQLRGYGINPDMLICRTEKQLNNNIKEKISKLCDIDKEYVIEGIDVDSIYKVPLKFKNQKMDELICKFFNVKYNNNSLQYWKDLVYKMENAKNEKTIAIVGKYVELHDAYLSIIESLKCAGAFLDTKINIKWIDSEEIEKDKSYEKCFNEIDGIIVPGGFGKRGTYGKILTAKYCRENNIPYLGICLGMQIAAIEFAINKLGYSDAISEEFDIDNLSNNHIIHLMNDQKNISQKGGTMRLGSYKCKLNPYGKIYNIYNKEGIIFKRHRHRYEFNNKYLKEFENNDMIMSGINPDNNLVEIIELKDHPFYVGAQYHPEFDSRFAEPEPLFIGLIKACLNK